MCSQKSLALAIGSSPTNFPAPSTWPCTMCPPMRPSTFSGSSRLTCAPEVMRENEVRVQVSFARSALKSA